MVRNPLLFLISMLISSAEFPTGYVNVFVPVVSSFPRVTWSVIVSLPEIIEMVNLARSRPRFFKVSVTLFSPLGVFSVTIFEISAVLFSFSLSMRRFWVSWLVFESSLSSWFRFAPSVTSPFPFRKLVKLRLSQSAGIFTALPLLSSAVYGFSE
mgnify:FL=1